MKKISIIVACSLLTAAYSVNILANNTKTITCPDALSLSDQFEKNWLYRKGSFYSYVDFVLTSGNRIVGMMITKNESLPADKNPHLQFSAVKLEPVDHYGVWNIICRYSINNAELNSNSAHLSMTASESLYDYNCKATTFNTVTCSPHTNK